MTHRDGLAQGSRQGVWDVSMALLVLALAATAAAGVDAEAGQLIAAGVLAPVRRIARLLVDRRAGLVLLAVVLLQDQAGLDV